MRKWLTISTFLLLPSWTIAQRISYSFRTITINNGLSQNSVIDAAHDEKGFLWFATQDGLNRYDGKDFLVFRKTFDDITTSAYSRLGRIIKGRNHSLWLVTSGGKLEKFNLLTETATPFKSLPRFPVLPAVSCVLEEQDGRLLIGTEREGLILYDPTRPDAIQRLRHTNTQQSLLTSDSIHYLLKSKDGNHYVLTGNGITALSVKGSQQARTYLHHSSGAAISFSVADEDESGNIWAGTYSKGLYVKQSGDKDFKLFTGYDTPALPANLVVQAIRADKAGRIWIGCFGSGLYIISPRDRTVRHFVYDPNDPFSIGYNDILCLENDRQEGMWIGTDGNGVSYYDKRLNVFTQLTRNNMPEDVPIDQVRSITTDAEGGLWIGTSTSGLTYSPDVRNNKAYIPVLRARKSNGGRIVSLLADKEDIWVGVQDSGLLVMDRFTKKVRHIYTPGSQGRTHLPDHTVWCMLPAGGKQAWLGTRNAGLCLFDKQAGLIRHYQYSPNDSHGIADNNIRCLTTINDSLLCLGFDSKGIQFFNRLSGQFVSLQPKAEQAIRDEQRNLKCLYYRKPELWIGVLGHGLMVLNLETGRLLRLNDEQGLPNNTIYSIVPDRLGSLWMSTNKGITRLMPPSDLATTSAQHFSLFTAEDGLPSNEFNTGAWYTDPKGIIYFGGIKGLAWFDPMKYLASVPPTNVVITQATINNEHVKSDTSILYKHELLLNHDDNSLSFRFAALDFVSPGKFKYYYQLEPYNQQWIAAGDRNYAAYTNLPPGDYHFKVKASGQSAGGFEPVTELHIVITPPFWRTWWFIILCIVALASLLYMLYKYRINQLIAMQKVRNRIATDLHDEIGSALTNISILSELSRQKLNDQQEAETFLNRISEEVNNSSQALDDIVWSINTNNDTLEQTVARMRRYAAEVFDAANIRYVLHLDEQFGERKLNMEQRRDCFLIFKETIRNIYKHAAATEVRINLWLENGRLHMMVDDNGQGFDPAHTTHRNGLKNMRQRVTRWNGSIDIRSAAGKGTRMSIVFDIQ